MPEQATQFGNGKRQQVGFEIERVFFPARGAAKHGERGCTRRWNSRPRGGGIGPLRVAV